MMRSDKLNLKEYICPIGIRSNDERLRFAGTGFGIEKPGLVLTASHVVAAATNKPQTIYLQLQDERFLQACSMEPHPTADVTALVFKDQSLRSFKLGEAPAEIGEFYLGTEVISYGYPYRQEDPDKVVLEPRLMGGHIQRNFRHDQDPYSFQACELSFPEAVSKMPDRRSGGCRYWAKATPFLFLRPLPVILGQSGSPILLKDDIDFAIALLTTNFESSTEIDSYEEHQENGMKEVHKIKKVVSYGIGAALWPLADWIRSL